MVYTLTWELSQLMETSLACSLLGQALQSRTQSQVTERHDAFRLATDQPRGGRTASRGYAEVTQQGLSGPLYKVRTVNFDLLDI